MVARISGSPAMVGYVGAVEVLPYLLVSPWAGILSDRMDRKKLMVVSDLARAIVLILLGVVVLFDDSPHMAFIFSAAFLLSTFSTFFYPARGAAVPALVPEDKLMRANSLSSATQSLMPLIGMGLSGGALGAVYLLFPNLFFLAAIGLNALSFIISAVCVMTLPPLLPTGEKTETTHAMTEFIEGLKTIIHRRALLLMLIIGMITMLLVSPFFVVYVTANNEWYGQALFPGADAVGASLIASVASFPGFQGLETPIKAIFTPGAYTTIAFLELAFIGGMFIGSLWVGRLKITRVGWAFSLNFAFIGLTIMFLAFYHEFWHFALMNFLAGLSLPFAQIPSMTYTTLIVPDSHRGRVNSVSMMSTTVAMPIGMAAAGLLVSKVGLETMFIIMGTGFFAGIPALLDPSFRNARMPETTE
jgi:MFS family permease